jgi:hypothetical protein
MLDRTDKAERYWNLMLRYHDLAEHAELLFLGDSYRKVASRYRAMAKEAFDRTDAKKGDEIFACSASIALSRECR